MRLRALSGGSVLVLLGSAQDHRRDAWHGPTRRVLAVALLDLGKSPRGLHELAVGLVSMSQQVGTLDNSCGTGSNSRTKDVGESAFFGFGDGQERWATSGEAGVGVLDATQVLSAVERVQAGGGYANGVPRVRASRPVALVSAATAEYLNGQSLGREVRTGSKAFA